MRLLVIGLDGATFRTLDHWMEAGWAGTLARLCRCGVRTPLISTTPPVTAPAWVSCFSGVNPGRHGIFNFVDDTTWGAYRPSSSRAVRVPRLWDMLGDQGCVVHVLDVPMTFPPQPVTGVMVSDLMVSGAGQGQTWPPELHEELIRSTGKKFRWAIGDGLEVSEAYLRHLVRSVEDKVNLDLYVADRYPADAFITVFQHMDVLHHYFWRVWDSSHPLHDVGEARRLMPWVERVVRALDRGVALLVEKAGAETLVAIVSDHGFGPARVRLHVNDLLYHWGDLRFSRSERLKLSFRRRGFSPSALTGFVRSRDHFGVLRRLRLSSARRALRAFESLGPRPDLSRSRAWFPHSLSAGIRLTDAAREDEAYVSDLMARLREAGVPGARCFERVERREDVYHGAASHLAPDIVLQPSDGYVLTAEITGGEGAHAVTTHQVSGYHRPEGVLILHGPRVREGKRIAAASILDVTPTLLGGSGLGVPGSLDGRCLDVSISETVFGTAGSRGVGEVGPDSEPGREEVFSSEEEAAILERLRSLGYV